MILLNKDLCAHLKLEGFYPGQEYDHLDAVLDHPATGRTSVAQLRENGGMGALNTSPVAHTDLQFTTPSGKLEFYSQQAQDSGCSALPDFTPRAADKYPLELRMGRTINHFHAFYDAGRALPALVRRDKRPSLWVSIEDAAERNISNGEAITLYNDRSRFDAHANVTDKVPAGTVWIHDGWPGLNDLTAGEKVIPDAAAALFPFSTGQSAFDAFIELETREHTELR